MDCRMHGVPMRSCDSAHVHTTIRRLRHPAQAGGGRGIAGDSVVTQARGQGPKGGDVVVSGETGR